MKNIELEAHLIISAVWVEIKFVVSENIYFIHTCIPIGSFANNESHLGVSINTQKFKLIKEPSIHYSYIVCIESY